jgi:hypothetical protein
MEVNDKFHALAALPPGKKIPVAIECEAGWASESHWKLWRKLLILLGSVIRVIKCNNYMM